MVDVCCVISQGFAARMILHSDVLPCLRARGLSVALIVPDAGEAPLRALAEQHQLRLAQMPPVSAAWLRYFGQVRYYLYEDVRRNPSLWAKHLRALSQARAGRRWRSLAIPAALWGFNRLTIRAGPVRAALQKVEQRLLADARLDALLQQLRPGLLVSTYPVAPEEARLLLAAQRAGIVTVGQLLSWDNITTKGRFAAVPDYFAAWGPVMRAELQDHYRVRPDRILETGVPHFDRHVTGVSEAGIRQAVAALGLDPARPYLFFGMMSPYFAPHEIDVVAWVAQAVEANRFGPDLQLVIRPHPQNMQGYLAETAWLPRLAALASSRVAIDYPMLEHSALLWNLHAADLPKLANLLAGCAVSFNSGSTLAIDAIIHDKPVILTLFDAGRQLPWWQSARRGGDYWHLARMISLGGVQVAHSFDQLEHATRRYLARPACDAEGRQRVRREEVGACDGQASQRVAAALHDFLLRGRPTPHPARPKPALWPPAEPA